LSDERPNPFGPENFVKIASVCAAIIYAVLFIGYRTYYHELGITPEDVGVGSTFVLVRSVGFIALMIGALALVALIIGVLDNLQKTRKKEDEPKNADQPADGQPTPEPPPPQPPDRNLCKKLEDLCESVGKRLKYFPWFLAIAFLAAVLFAYLLALKPQSWPVRYIVVAWLVLIVAAVIVERVAAQQEPDVGFVIAIGVSIVIAFVLPGVLVNSRAHELADSALRGGPPNFTVVKPYSLLNRSIPVLDVSSDVVDMEWICTDKNKKRPSVFDGRDISRGELLGESATSLYVRIDPPGKAAIVKLPAECVVIARYEDTPPAKG
jgi:hypothetical protein